MSDPTLKLPTALRELLVQVRAGLKKAGDTGAAGGRRSMVTVKMGWAEVRAVYALYTALERLRSARDAAKKDVQRARNDLERSRDDIADIDMLNNRAIVSLLVDVLHILNGDEESVENIEQTRARVEEVVDRARKMDRRRR